MVPESTPDPPTGYWVSFGWQTHAIPTIDRYKDSLKLTALCGVMAFPANIRRPDNRPRCWVCADYVREGRCQILPWTR